MRQESALFLITIGYAGEIKKKKLLFCAIFYISLAFVLVHWEVMNHTAVLVKNLPCLLNGVE